MRTPTTKEVRSLEYIGACFDYTFEQWEKKMSNTTKANGRQIRRLIKKHLPDLYYNLALDFPNLHEANSVKKEGMLIYNHSGIEYFLKFKLN